MNNDDNREIQKKAIIIVTIILMIAYFITLTSILVMCGKRGNFSDSIIPVISLTVTVIIPLLGSNIYSIKKNRGIYR